MTSYCQDVCLEKLKGIRATGSVQPMSWDSKPLLPECKSKHRHLKYLAGLEINDSHKTQVLPGQWNTVRARRKWSLERAGPIGKGMNAFRILARRAAVKSSVGIPNRWEDDFKIPIGKICCQEAKRVQTAQGSSKQQEIELDMRKLWILLSHS